jgi:L-amino acid N-acyltransferase YncA
MKIRLARQGDESAIAAVHVESWKTTYQGLVEESYLASLSVERREAMWKGAIERGYDNSCLYVAEAAGEIVGFASGGAERTKKFGADAEMYAIYLLKEHQGKGIGKRLVESVASFLSQKDYQSMLVWVLTANPSRYFYISLNPEEAGTEQILIGEKNYEEIAYVWKDIDELLSMVRKRRKGT